MFDFAVCGIAFKFIFSLEGVNWVSVVQCLLKPPVKTSTGPHDLVLQSDMKPVKRDEFDHQVVLFFIIFLP